MQTSDSTWVWCTEKFGSMLSSKTSLTIKLAEKCSFLWILRIFCLIFWVMSPRAKTLCNSYMAVMTVVQMHRFCSLAGPGISQECGLKRKLVGIHTMSLAFSKWGGALKMYSREAWVHCWKNHSQISLISAGALGYLWITLTTQIPLCTNFT